MSGLTDLLLSKPLSTRVEQVLLQFFFTFHMLFVLLTIGTAILAVFYFVRSGWTAEADQARWDKTILEYFLAHKSLAVVLGIGPLLLIQVGYTVPFFNATSIFAPYWLLIIGLLIVAFVSFDSLGHKIYTHRYLHLILAMLALTTLLIVPGIFVMLLVAAENSAQWPDFIRHGYRLTGRAVIVWIFRYLHVLGAAIVFGAAFHFYFAARNNRPRQHALEKWIVAGLLIQFVIGPLLAILQMVSLDRYVLIALVVGMASAVVLLAKLVSVFNTDRTVGLSTAAVLLMVLLTFMLTTRQVIQNKAFMPLVRKVEKHTAEFEKKVDAYHATALARYRTDLSTVYNTGETIYRNSCAFCHAADGDGKGPSAQELLIPPQNLRAIRSTRGYIYPLVVQGVPGSAMPYFAILDKPKVQGLLTYLGTAFNMFEAPNPIPWSVSAHDMGEARAAYARTCSRCHGQDGKGSRFGRQLTPPPPDFTQYSLISEPALQVITNGYSGTMMPAFGTLPAGVRQALVWVVYNMRFNVPP